MSASSSTIRILAMSSPPKRKTHFEDLPALSRDRPGRDRAPGPAQDLADQKEADAVTRGPAERCALLEELRQDRRGRRNASPDLHQHPVRGWKDPNFQFRLRSFLRVAHRNVHE